MIAGIVALVGIVFFPPFIDILIAFVGLLLGIIGKRQLSAAGHPTGMATAGIVMCSIVLVLAVLALLIFGVLITAVVGFLIDLFRG